MHISTEQLISLALQEDTAFGDLTSESIFPVTHQSVARIVARQALVLSGTEVARRVFERVDDRLEINMLAKDGDKMASGQAVMQITGSTASLLTAERTALNFLQRLCGIASQSRIYADAIAATGVNVRICDTRKTTPGWRLLEKHAVRCGGCFNHRFSLGEHVMIKDNHIAAVGSVHKAIELARLRAPHLSRIEVEADNLEQVDDALAAGADVILLDNMLPEQILQAVQRVNGQALIEISGGVTLGNLAMYAVPGVDVISVGALTHSAVAADLSMEVEAA